MPTYDWKKGHDPNSITSKIESYKKIDSNGNLVFTKAFEFSDDRILLTEMFDAGEQIPDSDKEAIINRAIISVGKKGKITSTRLKGAINLGIQGYNRRQEVKYVFIASLSINNQFQINRRKVNDCYITFKPRLERKFYDEYTKQQQESRQIIKANFPNNYLYSMLFVKAKSVHQANLKALNSLDLLRGIWNLSLNQKQPTRITFMGPVKPINKIALGPIETLHLSNGELATADFWYQPEYQGPISVFNSRNDLNRIFIYEQNARRLINDHKYRTAIENVIIRYVQALDLYNFQDTFIRLWGILESLTGKGTFTQEEIVKRVLFHYAVPLKDYLRQILNILRDFRNRAVHIGSNSKHIESLVYFLKQFVERLIVFHIVNKFNFSTLEETTDFFRLTQSKDIFYKETRLLKNLKKYHGW